MKLELNWAVDEYSKRSLDDLLTNSFLIEVIEDYFERLLFVR